MSLIMDVLRKGKGSANPLGLSGLVRKKEIVGPQFLPEFEGFMLSVA